MANGCAGLDPTWAHLPAPAPTHAPHYYSSSAAPACWLSPAAAFENEALTSALRASMSPAAHAQAAAAAAANCSASFSAPATPSSSSTSSASELLSSGHDAAPATARARARPGPAGPPRARAAPPAAGPRAGRVAKRKPRPSRRAQTTYISADPANFRRMVQEVTGLPFAPTAGVRAAAAEPASGPGPAAALSWTPPPAYVLPTLDTSAFLLDRPAATAAVQDEKQASTGAASTAATDAAAAANAVTEPHQADDDDDSSTMLLELEALVRAPAGASGFPTLESWGII